MFSLQDIFLATFLSNPIENWIRALAVLIISAGLLYLFHYLLIRFIKHCPAASETTINDFLIDIIVDVKHTVVWMTSLFLALKLVTLTPFLNSFINKGILIFLTVRIAWFLQSFFIAKIQELTLNKLNSQNSKIQKQINPLMTKILITIVWIIAVLLIIANLGYNVTSLIAGLGIGGIFVGLAAQETLSNFISSIAVFLDKPFNVGDLISFGNTTGTIEDFGLRSTRIRTFEGTLVIVPNNIMAKETLTNVSNRQGRRTEQRISLTYNTSTEKLKEAIQIIKDTLGSNTHVQSDNYLVHFLNFSPSSLDIDIIYYVKLLDTYNDVQNVRQDINFRIKSLLEKAKIKFAYPTSTIHIEK